ncbi:hypothetical protein AK830_g4624 [Neonectria ditissima]|uniref:Uncharacterized protein n=1 Tax=Neonectria ditissima TaxID=78410 RepID=A0A0P7B7Y5_9HYPO|nr:hypothetical protein AK830_g4624 [Neonectria ditissima]
MIIDEEEADESRDCLENDTTTNTDELTRIHGTETWSNQSLPLNPCPSLELARTRHPDAYHAHNDEAAERNAVAQANKNNQPDVAAVGRLQDAAAKRNANQGSVGDVRPRLEEESAVVLPKAGHAVDGRKRLSVVLRLAQLADAHRDKADATAATETEEDHKRREACDAMSRRQPYAQHRD